MLQLVWTLTTSIALSLCVCISAFAECNGPLTHQKKEVRQYSERFPEFVDGRWTISDSDQAKMVRDYVESRDPRLREFLIAIQLTNVLRIANKFNITYQAELISIGNLAVVEALDKMTKPPRSTYQGYMSMVIYSKMIDYFRSNSNKLIRNASELTAVENTVSQGMPYLDPQFIQEAVQSMSTSGELTVGEQDYIQATIFESRYKNDAAYGRAHRLRRPQVSLRRKSVIEKIRRYFDLENY